MAKNSSRRLTSEDMKWKRTQKGESRKGHSEMAVRAPGGVHWNKSDGLVRLSELPLLLSRVGSVGGLIY